MKILLRIFLLVIFVVIFGIILIAGGFFLYIQFAEGTKTLTQETLCNGLLLIQAKRVNRGFERGLIYEVNIFYVKNNKKKLVGSITKRRWDAFHPLPRNTATPYYFINGQDMEYSTGYAGIDNLFVDPNTFARSEFDDIGSCAEKEAASINKITAQVPSLSGPGATLYLGGFIYDTFEHHMQIVSALNTDPVFRLDYENSESYLSDYPTFLINPWGTIFYNGEYEGDIFGGLAHDSAYYGGSLEAKNSSGKRFGEYLEQIKRSLVSGI